MNKALLIGRLVAQPELNKTANDKAYVRGTLAVNRRFKNEAGQREADFISLIIWGKTAENFASYAKKGSLLSIEAEIRTRTFVDQKNQTRYVTELLVLAYHLLESRATLSKRENSQQTEAFILEGEELPF
ncbi:MAG: single-stranded DNA-binding protein [Lactococcus sp.]